MTTEAVAQVVIEKDLVEEVQVAEITGVVAADNATTGVEVAVAATTTDLVVEVVITEIQATGILRKDINSSAKPVVCHWADSTIGIEIPDLKALALTVINVGAFIFYNPI